MAEGWLAADVDLAFVGHTHLPLDRQLGPVRAAQSISAASAFRPPPNAAPCGPCSTPVRPVTRSSAASLRTTWPPCSTTSPWSGTRRRTGWRTRSVRVPGIGMITPATSAPELLALHAVRLKGMADDRAGVADALRPGPGRRSAELLLDFQAYGWISRVEFGGSGRLDADRGRARDTERASARPAELADDRDGGGASDAGVSADLPARATPELPAARARTGSCGPPAPTRWRSTTTPTSAWDRRVLDVRWPCWTRRRSTVVGDLAGFGWPPAVRRVRRPVQRRRWAGSRAGERGLGDRSRASTRATPSGWSCTRICSRRSDSSAAGEAGQLACSSCSPAIRRGATVGDPRVRWDTWS